MSQNEPFLENYNISQSVHLNAVYGSCEQSNLQYVNFGTPTAPQPPQYSQVMGNNSSPIQLQLFHSTNITEVQVRSALKNFVADNLCFSSEAANNMIITDIVMNSAFHYKLETFTEKRETKPVSKPYGGELTIASGLPPSQWELNVVPNVSFQKSMRVIEIPNTAKVIVCDNCVGNGRVRCNNCQGNGGSCCLPCNGSGFDTNNRRNSYNGQQNLLRNNRCNTCNGSGRKRCQRCSGHGQVDCSICKGHGRVRTYQELTVRWYNHEENYSNFISGSNPIPWRCIQKAPGKTVFNDRQPRVLPITDFAEQAVNETSKRLIDKHLRSFPSEIILEQRHSLRLIPIASVNYCFKGQSGTFHVYGDNRKVFFPDYPTQCCCCSIL